MQVHARCDQTESQVDPSFQFGSTCDSVWPGLKKTTTVTATGARTSLNKSLMSRTIAVHVHYIIPRTFLCRPLQTNNVKRPNSALSGEREPRRLLDYFLNFYFQFITVS